MQKYGNDIEVDIYESATKLTEVGAGIGMWRRVLDILKYLGLEDDLREISGARDSTRELLSTRVPVFFIAHVFGFLSTSRALPQGRRGGGGRVSRIRSRQYGPFSRSTVAFIDIVLHLVTTFGRMDLQAVLVKHLREDGKIFYSKRLATYVEPQAGQLEPIVLHFTDGTSTTCDLLVGSDGIRSATRRTMFSNLADAVERNGDSEQATHLRTMIDPVWSGQVVYRGLVPVDKLTTSAHGKELRELVLIVSAMWITICYPKD